MMMMDGHGSPARPTVCVTGSTGYIGSWLVQSLLRRGNRVHATARDTDKATQLLSSSEGNDRLSIFRADLSEEGSFDEAVKGCIGLFHVAASMEFNTSAKENIGKIPTFYSQPSTTTLLQSKMKSPVIRILLNASVRKIQLKKITSVTFFFFFFYTNNTKQQLAIDEEDHVRSKILEPAVRGTMNVLRACIRSGTVKRVVFTSSISTITAKDDKGNNWRSVVDESSTTPVDKVWNSKPSGWVYVLSKLLTEEKAFEFAEAKGIELVSIIPPTVAGPFLTPSVPASVRVLLSPITGDPVLYPILVSVNSRLGSISLAHIEDICNAHILLMENADAKGRYLCSAGSYTIPQLADLLSSEYPSFSSERFRLEFHDSIPSEISSKRLISLGFEFKYDVREIVRQSVECCINCGFLS